MDRCISRVKGFTLVELMLVMAIVVLLTAFAIPSYKAYIRDARAAAAIADIGAISIGLEKFRLDNNGLLPDSLADIYMADKVDPWGQQYVYQRLEGVGNGIAGVARKDKNLNPINTDFDLYSIGEDERTANALTARASKDDIIRAGNGNFLGYAEDY